MTAVFPAGLEPATFRVLGGRDNHYTTETTCSFQRKLPDSKDENDGVHGSCHCCCCFVLCYFMLFYCFVLFVCLFIYLFLSFFVVILFGMY